MTPATIIGCLLLLANPQPRGALASAFLLQAQETTPQNPPEPPPPIEEAQPAAPEKTEPAQAVPQEQTPKPVTPKKTKPKPAAAKKTPKKRVQPKENAIVVIKNGGTADAQGRISSTSDQQALEKRKNTNSLLATTSSNLKNISGKQLTPGQQDMVKQIHNYMSQSQEAARNGDVQGANNLAVKAHLLSEELVKH